MWADSSICLIVSSSKLDEFLNKEENKSSTTFNNYTKFSDIILICYEREQLQMISIESWISWNCSFLIKFTIELLVGSFLPLVTKTIFTGLLLIMVPTLSSPLLSYRAVEKTILVNPNPFFSLAWNRNDAQRIRAFLWKLSHCKLLNY